jgi:hypothetical protein
MVHPPPRKGLGDVPYHPGRVHSHSFQPRLFPRLSEIKEEDLVRLNRYLAAYRRMREW